MILQVSNGCKSYGSQEVFQQVNFTVNDKEKIAIVGRNGCGKTTLIKCICGSEQLDSGVIHKIKNCRIGLLSQMAFNDESITVQQVFDDIFAPVNQKQCELDKCIAKLTEDSSAENLDTYQRLLNEFELLGGYNIHNEMMTVLTQFGFSEQDLQRQISTFSGGQKTRIAFATLLLSHPDVLFLDEPTNHLDLPTIIWLEGYIKKYPQAVVLVSHDRMFLDHIVDSVYEIEYGHMTYYKGNYSNYVLEKKKNYELQAKNYRIQQKEIKRLEELIEKFRYKKNKAAFAQSKIKYLDRMDKIDDPLKGDTKSFVCQFDCEQLGGKTVAQFDNLTVGYDKPLLSWTYDIYRGNRIALIGPNGCGKSTFLKTIVGKLQPLSGAFILGHQIKIGYFDQQLAQLNSNKTVLDELWDEYPDMGQAEIRTVLGHFLFTADEVFKQVSDCSGGEKVRLALAKLLLQKANFLVLDEPTNHLDIIGKETLEDSLKNYPGTILFVSHDRYFIEKIATSIASISNGQVSIVETFNVEKESKTKKEEADKKVKQEETKPRIIKINVEREIKKIEEQIAIKEEKLEELRDLRFEPQYYQDSNQMAILDEQIDDIHNEIKHLYDSWEEKSLLLEECE